MADHFDSIAETFAKLPDDVKTTVFVAGDNVTEISDARELKKSSARLAGEFKAAASQGGCDNIPALLQAFERAADEEKTIIWVHAAQPVLLQTATPLLHWLERNSQVTIYDFPVADGPNRLAEQLGTLGFLQSTPRLDGFCNDLHALFMRLSGNIDEFRLERKISDGEQPMTPQSTSHLARLWAFQQIVSLARTGKASDREKAVQLAVAYQLVSPVSGAVVLETKQQYDDSNLKPVDPDSTPNTPEPAVWIMLLTAAPWILWHYWRRRRCK